MRMHVWGNLASACSMASSKPRLMLKNKLRVEIFGE